jgi:Pyruvate/2-oxoacid:ferredoxin oxidoreductase delta subunit
MAKRKIVQIDAEKCDGCGQCTSACAEGAIQIVDGKARLVSDVYCDGLGACLGKCPRDAITIVEREAAAFDEAAVQQRTARPHAPRLHAASGGCPGAAARSLLNAIPPQAAPARPVDDGPEAEGPALANWPIQLRLVPPSAPFLKGADLFLVADCAAFAFAGFHGRLLRRRPLVIGCPKLDDAQFYVEKLADIIQVGAIRSLTVVHMEVPCCTGLVRIAQAAIGIAGGQVPLEEVTISISGKILGTDKPTAATPGA